MTIGRIPSVEGGIQPTIVDAKGDILTATAADTPAVLSVGNNGETLVADSSATTGLRWTATPSASNPVLNGAYDIWQRGTSISVAASTLAYTADRWQLQTNANQASTVSRQATGDTTNLPAIQYCARVQRNSGQTGTDNFSWVQSFETTNSIPFAGKTVTLSFYARRGADYSATSNLLYVYLATGTGTDQNYQAGYTGQAFPIDSSVTLTTTWQRFTLTGTIAATATEMATRFVYPPTGTAGASDFFEITGVQIDVGSTALPFRRTGGTLAGELAVCQRYYFRANPGSNAYGRFASGRAWSTTTMEMIMPLPTAMRVPPTTVEYANVITSTANAISAITVTQPTTTTAAFDVTSTGLTTNQYYLLIGNNSTSAYVGVSAEL